MMNIPREDYERNEPPLPWEHKTDGKKMSAIVDANGACVCGSLICQGLVRDRKAHALILKAVNAYKKGGE